MVVVSSSDVAVNHSYVVSHIGHHGKHRSVILGALAVAVIEDRIGITCSDYASGCIVNIHPYPESRELELLKIGPFRTEVSVSKLLAYRIICCGDCNRTCLSSALLTHRIHAPRSSVSVILEERRQLGTECSVPVAFEIRLCPAESVRDTYMVTRIDAEGQALIPELL